MRGARGDAARRAEAAQATTSQSAFSDYVKFDDMFGASCIFTSGDPVQVQRQREAYVQDTMTRKLYGYVHRLETHGAPIQRVVVGGGCEAAENRGGFPTSRPRDAAAGAHAVDALANEDPLAFSRKRARVGGSSGGRAGVVSPAARGGVAPPCGARAFDGPNARLSNEGSLANLFEPNLGEDWEHDPLWAAMDSLATPGSVGGLGGPLEDPSALLPGALSRGAATEEDLMRRARIELIEERLHSLEHALASERVPKRSETAAGAGGSGGSDKSNAFVRSRGGSGGDDAGRVVADLAERSGPATNLFQSGLFVATGRRDQKRRSSGDASDKSGSGGSGKDPQSPSPAHRAPPNPSRSRSQSDERGSRERLQDDPRRSVWNDAEALAAYGARGRDRTPLATSEAAAAPSAEFPATVPDDGALFGGGLGEFGGAASGDLADAATPAPARRPEPNEPTHSALGGGGHKVSTSFTSTPGGARAGAGARDFGRFGAEGESPRAAARRLARENAALAEERRRAKRERDVLLAEHEHNKAQAALLQASNAQYERRVAQLEALVREQTTAAARAARFSEFETRATGEGAECAAAKAVVVAEDVAEKTSSDVEGVMSG